MIAQIEYFKWLRLYNCKFNVGKAVVQDQEGMNLEILDSYFDVSLPYAVIYWYGYSLTCGQDFIKGSMNNAILKNNIFTGTSLYGNHRFLTFYGAINFTFSNNTIVDVIWPENLQSIIIQHDQMLCFYPNTINYVFENNSFINSKSTYSNMYINLYAPSGLLGNPTVIFKNNLFKNYIMDSNDFITI